MPPGVLRAKILHNGVGVIRRAGGKVGGKVNPTDAGTCPCVGVGSAVPDPLTGSEGGQAIVSQDARSDDKAPREGEAEQIVRPAEPGQVAGDAHAIAVRPDLNRRIERAFMLNGSNGLPLKFALRVGADDTASIHTRQTTLRVCLLDGEPIHEEGGAILARQKGLSLKNETSGTCY